MGELAAEPGVLVGELLVAVEGGGQPGAQRRIGGPLGSRDAAGSAGGVCLLPQPADLAADVGLGIEPGPGDPRFSELKAIIDIDHLMAVFRTHGERL
jgi:hypothetical protein